MESAIHDLVKMRDFDSLYEVMTENDDFMYCLDAAEGLVMLEDPRGVEFLKEATLSEDQDISNIAHEILDSPDVRRKLEDIQATRKQERESFLETARKRIQEGRKVFIYKTIYLASSFFLGDELNEEPQSVPALNDFGFEGWEVTAFVGKVGRNNPLIGSGAPGGGFFLLKKEIAADEVSELDEL